MHSTAMRGDEKLKCHVRLESLPQAHLSAVVAVERHNRERPRVLWRNRVRSRRHSREDNSALANLTMMQNNRCCGHLNTGRGNANNTRACNLASRCYVLLFRLSLPPLRSHLCHSSHESVSPVLRALTVNPGAPGYGTDGHKL